MRLGFDLLFFCLFFPFRRHLECRTDQFRCGSGQCIEGDRRCDRTVDCPDRSDESNCGKFPVRVCTFDFWLMVYPTSWICVGVQCKSGEFSCVSGDQCVPYSLVCDGRRDCQDFSDEAECRKCFPPVFCYLFTISSKMISSITRPYFFKLVNNLYLL